MDRSTMRPTLKGDNVNPIFMLYGMASGICTVLVVFTQWWFFAPLFYYLAMEYLKLAESD